MDVIIYPCDNPSETMLVKGPTLHVSPSWVTNKVFTFELFFWCIEAWTNGRHLADGISLSEKYSILIEISLKFVSKVQDRWKPLPKLMVTKNNDEYHYTVFLCTP